MYPFSRSALLLMLAAAASHAGASSRYTFIGEEAPTLVTQPSITNSGPLEPFDMTGSSSSGLPTGTTSVNAGGELKRAEVVTLDYSDLTGPRISSNTPVITANSGQALGSSMFTVMALPPMSDYPMSGFTFMYEAPPPITILPDRHLAPSLQIEMVSEVPLPAGAWLFGSALLGLATARRKRH